MRHLAGSQHKAPNLSIGNVQRKGLAGVEYQQSEALTITMWKWKKKGDIISSCSPFFSVFFTCRSELWMLRVLPFIWTFGPLWKLLNFLKVFGSSGVRNLFSFLWRCSLPSLLLPIFFYLLWCLSLFWVCVCGVSSFCCVGNPSFGGLLGGCRPPACLGPRQCGYREASFLPVYVFPRLSNARKAGGAKRMFVLTFFLGVLLVLLLVFQVSSFENNPVSKMLGQKLYIAWGMVVVVFLFFFVRYYLLKNFKRQGGTRFDELVHRSFPLSS